MCWLWPWNWQSHWSTKTLAPPEKYHVSLILGRWFLIQQSFFDPQANFCSVASCRFFDQKLYFRKYFEILKFFKNFQNFESVIFDQKTVKLATLQKLARRSKNNCRIRNQRPKIKEVRLFSRGAKFLLLLHLYYYLKPVDSWKPINCRNFLNENYRYDFFYRNDWTILLNYIQAWRCCN